MVRPVVLTVTFGIPGSGKTTWARRQHGHVITLDGFRHDTDSDPFPAAVRIADRRLGAGQDVIIDACSLNPTHRATWLRLARHHKTPTRLAVLHCHTSEAWRRQANRAPDARVPRSVVYDYARRFGAQLRQAQHEPWDKIVRIT